jgi:hypothetical protein
VAAQDDATLQLCTMRLQKKLSLLLLVVHSNGSQSTTSQNVRLIEVHARREGRKKYGGNTGRICHETPYQYTQSNQMTAQEKLRKTIERFEDRKQLSSIQKQGRGIEGLCDLSCSAS